ncbi:MAG: hypothetical protein ABUL62_00545 [Myxococcales bacterium]|jgi:hypothetical protein
MNTVFARAVLALGLVALPASALASTKASTKHGHSVAHKEAAPTKKKGKHHGHKSNATKGVAATPAKPSVAAKAAPAEPADDSSPKAQ